MFWLLQPIALVLLLSIGEHQQRLTLPVVPSSTLDRVRSTDIQLLEAIREGCSRSATFNALVDALNRTSAVVYVERGICGFGHYRACLPHTIVLAGGNRFLRIVVDSRQKGAPLLALIAHELQHGLEIAVAPKVRTADDVTELFRRIGRSPHCPLGTPDCYETSAALAIGDAVLAEATKSFGR
jgi:hypothetical protein